MGMVNQIDEAVRARVWPGIGSEAIQQLNHYYQTHMSEANRRDFDETAVAHMRAGETGAYYGGYYNGAYRTLFNNGTYYNFHSSITSYEEFGDLYSRETAGKTWQMVNQIDEAVRARVWPIMEATTMEPTGPSITMEPTTTFTAASPA